MKRNHAERRAIFTRYFRMLVSRKGLLLSDIRDVSDLASSSLSNYHNGQKLPTMDTGARLAEACADTRLLSVLRACRTKECKGCGVTFLDRSSHGRATYHDKRCRRAREARIMRGSRRDDTKLKLRERSRMQDAIAAFCAECPWMEVEGYCPLPDVCALGDVTPLPSVKTPKLGRAASTASPRMLRYIDRRFRPELVKETA